MVPPVTRDADVVRTVRKRTRQPHRDGDGSVIGFSHLTDPALFVGPREGRAGVEVDGHRERVGKAIGGAVERECRPRVVPDDGHGLDPRFDASGATRGERLERIFGPSDVRTESAAQDEECFVGHGCRRAAGRRARQFDAERVGQLLQRCHEAAGSGSRPSVDPASNAATPRIGMPTQSGRWSSS